MCAPCLLEWLALAGLDRFLPSSHIQRLGFCSRASSTLDTPRKVRERPTVQREWRKNSSTPTPLRHPALIMAEIWQGVDWVLDAIRSLLTMPSSSARPASAPESTRTARITPFTPADGAVGRIYTRRSGR